MKVLVKFSLLCSLAFFSCKTDAPLPLDDTINEQLKGVWVTTTLKWVYYDSSNNVLAEILKTEDEGTKHEFDGQKLTYTYRNDPTPGYYNYVIKEHSGRNIIQLSYDYDNHQSPWEHQIFSITDSQMVWLTKVNNKSYYKDNVQYTADSAVFKIQFVK